MRDLREVLRQKEVELERVTQEVEALRLAQRLLAEDADEKGRSGPAGDSSRDRTTRVKVFP